jgi:hypothetical protein
MYVDENWDVQLKDIPAQVCVSHWRPLISKLGKLIIE